MNKNKNKDRTHPLGEYANIYEIKEQFDKQRVNKPEIELEELHGISDKLIDILKDKSEDCAEELLAGLTAVKQYPKTVSFFGSARTKEGSAYYEKARELAGEICKEGFTVITGGGPGIMEAANRGSKEACGYAVGFNIELPSEQVINPYVTHGVNFKFFSARKMALFFSAEACLFFPGGFGTLDEFFQVITLVQTRKTHSIPLILVGSEFWNPLDEFIKETLLGTFKTISPEDVNLYHISDDKEEILNIIRNTPKPSANT